MDNEEAAVDLADELVTCRLPGVDEKELKEHRKIIFSHLNLNKTADSHDLFFIISTINSGWS